MRFAVDVARPGYNRFVLGEPDSNRHEDVRKLLLGIEPVRRAVVVLGKSHNAGHMDSEG